MASLQPGAGAPSKAVLSPWLSGSCVWGHRWETDVDSMAAGRPLPRPGSWGARQSTERQRRPVWVDGGRRAGQDVVWTPLGPLTPSQQATVSAGQRDGGRGAGGPMCLCGRSWPLEGATWAVFTPSPRPRWPSWSPGPPLPHPQGKRVGERALPFKASGVCTGLHVPCDGGTVDRTPPRPRGPDSRHRARARQ